jgi:hypothetical protein
MSTSMKSGMWVASADGDEVDVLEHAADRVDLDLLGQRELLVALDVELEQGVRAAVLERHHRGVAREGQVDRVVAVAVHDRGDLVLAADPAGGTLAELVALLGGDLLGSHQLSPRALVGGPRRLRRTAQTGGTMGRPSRSRHSPLARGALAEATSEV